jgi:NAD(P)-dependent dehydrogenase (short-subunit alcohol dehydrogenase family)
MARRFEGQSVFITGASSGIGAATALEFAREGARVALAARRTDRLDEVRKRIEALGGQAVATPCDVTDRAGLDAAVAATVAAFGRIDVAVANAGFGVTGPFEELDTAGFRRQFETNVFGVIETIYAVLPHLVASKGRLGIVSSGLGRFGLPLSSAYCASKFALCGLAESIDYELRAKGVSVTCIQPGIVASEIRTVDNTGLQHPGHEDPAPKSLIVPTDQAAREIVRALYRRKFEAVITRHARILVGLSRQFSRPLRAFVLFALSKRDVMGRRGKPPAQGGA